MRQTAQGLASASASCPAPSTTTATWTRAAAQTLGGACLLPWTAPPACSRRAPKALHFVGHRKIGLEVVHSSLINGSLLGVYQEWDLLPHDQSKYDSYGQRRQLLQQT